QDRDDRDHHQEFNQGEPLPRRQTRHDDLPKNEKMVPKTRKRHGTVLLPRQSRRGRQRERPHVRPAKAMDGGARKLTGRTGGKGVAEFAARVTDSAPANPPGRASVAREKGPRPGEKPANRSPYSPDSMGVGL